MTVVRDQTVGAYVDALASSSAVPGGGSAAALAAAMGAALVGMVAKLSAKKAREASDREFLDRAAPQLEALTARLIDLSQQDVDAYRSVIDARKARASGTERQRAVLRAAEVPLETAQAAGEALDLAAEVSKRAWEMTASDLAVGSDLLEAGRGGALGNVAINLPDLEGDAAARVEARYRELRQREER